MARQTWTGSDLVSDVLLDDVPNNQDDLYEIIAEIEAARGVFATLLLRLLAGDAAAAAATAGSGVLVSATDSIGYLNEKLIAGDGLNLTEGTVIGAEIITLSAPLVADTTPQLGGDLDLNGHVITDLVVSDTTPQLGGDLDLNGHVIIDLVVSDTTPQLGGDLDVNGKALGDGTCEFLKFSETAFAVNEITIKNAATGNGPEVSVSGDDTNIDLKLSPKGTGVIDFNDKPLSKPRFIDVAETVNPLGTLTGGTDDIDLELGNVVTATISTAAQTFTFSNPPVSGVCGSFTLIITNGGSQTITWPGSVKWPISAAPILTGIGIDVLVFTTIDGGTTWLGFTAGRDMS